MLQHIAFLDILGFKNIVATTPPEDILAIYRDIEGLVESEVVVREFESRIMHAAAHENTYAAPLVAFEVRFFSDTIVIYSTTGYQHSMHEADLLCRLVSRIYTYLLVKHGWLVRGAIAMGDLHVEGSAIIGDGLIRAAEAEKAQDWAGVIVLDKTGIMDNQYNIYTFEYDVPFKDGRRSAMVLNPFVTDNDPLPFQESVKALALARGKAPSAAVVTKLENTRLLFEYAASRGVSAMSAMTSALDSLKSGKFDPLGLFPGFTEGVENLLRRAGFLYPEWPESVTPAEIVTRLELDTKDPEATFRRWLRRNYPEHPPKSRWVFTPDEADALIRRWKEQNEASR
jgi:hypothetical protein